MDTPQKPRTFNTSDNNNSQQNLQQPSWLSKYSGNIQTSVASDTNTNTCAVAPTLSPISPISPTSPTSSTTILPKSRPPLPPQAFNRIHKQNEIRPQITPSKLNKVVLSKTLSDKDVFGRDSTNSHIFNASPQVANTTNTESKCKGGIRKLINTDNSSIANENTLKASLKLFPSLKVLQTTNYASDGDKCLTPLESIGKRSPSPACSSRSSLSSSRRLSSTRLQTPPRRIYPQTYIASSQTDELKNLEQSPVIFDANLSFVWGCQKQPVHQTVKPTPSHQNSKTASAQLSEKIQSFLQRTDHIQQEWTAMGHRQSSHQMRAASVANTSRCHTPSSFTYDNSDTFSLIQRQRERNSEERFMPLGRSRSAQNILTKAFQLTKTLPPTPTSRSNSIARDLSNDNIHDQNNTMEECSEIDEVILSLYSSCVQASYKRTNSR